MNQHKATKFTITTRQLLGALSLAAAITAFTPLVATHAQEDRPGNDMAHQERNPSQHPELFSGPAATARSTTQTTTPVAAPAPRRATTRRSQARALFFITPLTPVRNDTARTTDDRVGNDTAHQERNPSAHPELWVLNASR